MSMPWALQPCRFLGTIMLFDELSGPSCGPGGRKRRIIARRKSGAVLDRHDCFHRVGRLHQTYMLGSYG